MLKASTTLKSITRPYSHRFKRKTNVSKQTEDAIGISIIIFLVIVGIVGCVLIEENKPDENKILQSKLKNHEIVIDSTGHKWNYTCISGKGYLKTFFATNTNYQAVIIEDPSTEYAKCK